MLLFETYVAASTIEGVGVFAAEPIPAGARIWLLEPRLDRLFPIAELDSLPPSAQAFARRYGYVSGDDTTQWVLELDNGRFMNHSTSPNTRFDLPDGGYAIREIAKGEELTCNYADFLSEFTPPEGWTA